MANLQNGVLINNTGTVESFVYGFGGTAPAGLTFQAVADWTTVTIGQAAPPAVAATLAATDHETSRGVEDLAALLISKNIIARTDLPAQLLAKINARRALRNAGTL